MLAGMGVVKQKYARSSVSPGQIQLLDLVYKYRFISRQLIAETLGINQQNGLHERLEVLIKYGYLDKRFDKRLKLLGKPAAYYLTPKGLRLLQALPNHGHVTDTVIKASYRDKTVSQEFINHTLDVYRYTNVLKRHYPTLKIFTRRDMTRYDYFPEQLPDALLSLPTNDPAQPLRYFFDLVSDSLPRTALERRITYYCDFFESGGWDVTGTDIPAILLLSESGTAEKRVQRTIRLQLARADMEELQVFTSTTAALNHMASETAIWTSVDDTDTLVGLSSIS